MISVIIAAAGSGRRMGLTEKKQFLDLLGSPILVRTLNVFNVHPLIDEIIVVTNSEDIDKVQAMSQSYKLNKVTSIVSGGERRQDSINNALSEVRGEIVLIHDAARPFVTPKIIEENIKSIDHFKGVVTGVPVKDTIKYVENGLVKETLNRQKLLSVQTPQTFRSHILKEAYGHMDSHQLSVTDDSSLLEMMGYDIGVVEGSYENIKITTIEDLRIAEEIIRSKACE